MGRRVVWWRGSERFEESYWIDPRSPLSQATLAGALDLGLERSPRPHEVDLQAWVDEVNGPEDACLMEEVVSMEIYGKKLSLLYVA